MVKWSAEGTAWKNYSKRVYFLKLTNLRGYYELWCRALAVLEILNS